MGLWGWENLAPLLDRRSRLRLGLLVIASAFGAMLEMLGIASVPAFLAVLLQADEALRFLPAGFSRVLPESREIGVVSAAVALGVFFLAKNLYLAGVAAFESRLLRNITVDNTTKLFERYLRSSYSLHLERNPSELIRNVSQSVSDAVEYLRNAATTIREGLVLLVTLTLLLSLATATALGIVGVLTIAVVLFLGLVRRSLAAWGADAQELYARQLKTLNEAFGAVKSIRLAGREGHFVRRFSAETTRLWANDYRHRFVATLPRLVLELVAVVSVLFVAVAFLTLRQNIDEILLALALIVVAVIRLIPAFNAITTATANIRYYEEALRTVAVELTTVAGERSPALGSIPALSSRLELSDVHFRYSGEREEALSGVNLTIPAGEVVGLVGPTGAGKSTLVDVLLGLLEPTAGAVLVDGCDVRTALRSWQDQIGYVPQDIYLTDDTVRRNIAFGLADDDIDDARVERAVAAAQLADFVASLPDGLETMVGNRGVRVSGGQRQRIAIARALYNDPAVLVLDEATSSLDHETEAAVIESVERLRGTRTIILIAHRERTLSPCQRIYYLRGGRVVREGSPGRTASEQRA